MNSWTLLVNCFVFLRKPPVASLRMIHYTCDMCGRPLGPDDLRYVVKTEVYAAMDVVSGEDDDFDVDHLEQLGEMLEQLDDDTCANIGEDVCQQMRFDLCPTCREKFVKNPLGRETVSTQFNFSKN